MALCSESEMLAVQIETRPSLSARSHRRVKLRVRHVQARPDYINLGRELLNAIAALSSRPPPLPATSPYTSTLNPPSLNTSLYLYNHNGPYQADRP